MNKLMKCICMMVLVALSFTSCNKTEEKHNSTFRAIIKDAAFEVVGEDKAYVDSDNIIQFEQGDVCMVFNLDDDHPANSHCATYEALESGNFVGFQNCGLGEVAEEKLDYFMAFYPGGSDRLQSQLSGDYNKAKFIISNRQYYREDKVSRGDLFMVATVDDANLSQGCFVFESIMGVLQFQPYESRQGTITQIQVYDLNFNLAGELEVNLGEQKGTDKSRAIFDAMDGSKEGSNHIDLYLPDGGVQLGASKATTPKFNIVLRPLALYGGCHIIVTYATGEVKDVYVPAEMIVIKPNTVTNLGVDMVNW